MDESRKQFEEWMTDMGKHPLAIEKIDGNYILASARTQWEAWTASRAAIEIDLPMQKYTCFSQGFYKGLAEQRKNDTDILRAAGIKVKK